MWFYAAESDELDEERARTEYRNAKTLGRLRLGEERLFLRSGLRVWCIPYRSVRRVFRRVICMPEKVRLWRDCRELDYLVFCGDGDQELGWVRMPGPTAAKLAMGEIRKRVPGISVHVPPGGKTE